jgi:hypothetical protein
VLDRMSLRQAFKGDLAAVVPVLCKDATRCFASRSPVDLRSSIASASTARSVVGPGSELHLDDSARVLRAERSRSGGTRQPRQVRLGLYDRVNVATQLVVEGRARVQCLSIDATGWPDCTTTQRPRLAGSAVRSRWAISGGRSPSARDPRPIRRRVATLRLLPGTRPQICRGSPIARRMLCRR